MGVSSCQNMIVNVLVQLKGEQEKANALIGTTNPEKSHCQLMKVDQVQANKGNNPIEACFDLEALFCFQSFS